MIVENIDTEQFMYGDIQPKPTETIFSISQPDQPILLKKEKVYVPTSHTFEDNQKTVKVKTMNSNTYIYISNNI